MQKRVYEYRVNTIGELKQRLVDVWHGLQQNVIDTAINEWRKRRHFEYSLWARWTEILFEITNVWIKCCLTLQSEMLLSGKFIIFRVGWFPKVRQLH